MSIWKDLLWVALGGALGSMLRYGCTLGVDHLSWHPLMATFLVNLLGSFLIGLVASSGAKGACNLLLSVGLCGGFTTFSTFSLQNVRLIQQGQYGLSLLYMGASLALCLLAAALGMLLGKALLHTN